MPITEVLEHYDLLEELEEKKDGYKGACPFHEGGTSSPFHISISKNLWYCHGACKKGGDVLDFVAKIEESSIRDAALLLANRFSLMPEMSDKGRKKAVERRDDSPEAGTAKNEALSGSVRDDLEEGKGVGTPKSDDSEATLHNEPLGFSLKSIDAEHEKLTGLGFPSDLIAEFGAGYCTKGLMVETLAIPVHSLTGELLAYAGWDLEEGGYRFPENFHPDLEVYNLHRAAKAPNLGTDGLIVVIHALDVWRLQQAGYQNAVALLGEEMSDRQATVITAMAKRECGGARACFVRRQALRHRHSPCARALHARGTARCFRTVSAPATRSPSQARVTSASPTSWRGAFSWAAVHHSHTGRTLY